MTAIHALLSGFLASPPPPRHPAFRIAAKSALGHRGKRARRQAFYSRARMARVLRRVMRSLPNIGPAVEQAHLDQLLYRTSVLQVSTTDGTKRRVDPRVMYYGFDGQEAPPPDGSPRDGEIASMLTIRTMTAAEFAASPLASAVLPRR